MGSTSSARGMSVRENLVPGRAIVAVLLEKSGAKDLKGYEISNVLVPLSFFEKYKSHIGGFGQDKFVLGQLVPNKNRDKSHTL